MNAQDMYNETKFLSNNHYLKRVLFDIPILATYKIIVFSIIIGCYGFSFYNT
jgi:hypothetical protein